MEIERARNALIVKSNDLIQKSRFDLSAVQQKVVLYLISQIKPYDEEFKLYEFSIQDFCDVCGIDKESGGNYSVLKKAIKEIADKSIWITLPDGKETLVRWIEKPYIDKNSGTIKIKIDEDMRPYLLQIGENFTKYELIWTVQFKSKYSIRLYEFIKSIHYYELATYEKIYSLEELRKLMGAEETNKDWKNFRVRVLEPAINEINTYSNKFIEYEAITKGKAVVKILLRVTSKDICDALNNKRI